MDFQIRKERFCLQCIITGRQNLVRVEGIYFTIHCNLLRFLAKNGNTAQKETIKDVLEEAHQTVLPRVGSALLKPGETSSIRPAIKQQKIKKRCEGKDDRFLDWPPFQTEIEAPFGQEKNICGQHQFSRSIKGRLMDLRFAAPFKCRSISPRSSRRRTRRHRPDSCTSKTSFVQSSQQASSRSQTEEDPSQCSASAVEHFNSNQKQPTICGSAETRQKSQTPECRPLSDTAKRNPRRGRRLLILRAPTAVSQQAATEWQTESEQLLYLQCSTKAGQGTTAFSEIPDRFRG